MTRQACCMCKTIQTGMTYASKAFCGPCRDRAIDFYLKATEE